MKKDFINFKPPRLISNRHIQSMYRQFFPYKSTISPTMEEVTLPDGDFIDLAWYGVANDKIAVLLHGLEGSMNSSYIQVAIDSFCNDNYQVVVLNLRSCSGRMNRVAKTYNSASTEDFTYIIDLLHARFATHDFSVVGFSLGANVLLNYLASTHNTRIKHAIAVSPTYEVGRSVDALAAIYQKMFLISIKAKVLKKIKLGQKIPISADTLKKIKTIREFDHQVTAPLFNYKNADEYYQDASCRNRLASIKNNTLIIQSLDDPFIPTETIPKQSEVSASVTLHITNKGGHVGFIQTASQRQRKPWLSEMFSLFINEK